MCAAAMLATFIGPRTASPAGLVTAERLADGSAYEVRARPARRYQIALLELVDAKTGVPLRVLFAGRMDQTQYVRLADDGSIPPGAYLLRYREGLSLEFEAMLKRPVGADPENADGGGWVNPVDLALAGDKLTVFDAGRPPSPLDPAEERRWHLPGDQWVTARYVSRDDANTTATLTTADGQSITATIAELDNDDRAAIDQYEAKRAAWAERRLRTEWPALLRLNLDGTADTTFGEGGWAKVAESEGQYGLRGIAVDESGTIYIGSGGHSVRVFSPTGERTDREIGGWDGEPHGPKCTPWANSVAVGPGNKLYIPNSYGNMKVYDRTKAGFDGILYHTTLAGGGGALPRAGACDALTHVVYVVNSSHAVERYVDDGKSIAHAYTAKADFRTPIATGPYASGGLIWIAAHGPGYGPYWDSGGGGEVVLLWDNGQSIELVDRFGYPGVETEELAFLNPSAVVMDQTHRTVWVAEDGQANPDGPPGNARVRRFRLHAVHTEELPIELRGKP